MMVMSAGLLRAQNEDALIKKVKAKLDAVNDYQAKGRMIIDVSFINAPESDVVVYFKKPNKLKVKKEGGISLLPKGGVSLNLHTLLSDGQFVVVPAGSAVLEGVAMKMVKLLPLKENSEVVLTTLWIDEREALIRKSSVTTKESGTYDMLLTYGKMKKWGLPDKVVFSFSTKDYKLPKGITFEYEKGGKKAPIPKDAKGSVTILYQRYDINKGVKDEVFQ
jgi:outer membrane lipoprotein-sorting protein